MPVRTRYAVLSAVGSLAGAGVIAAITAGTPPARTQDIHTTASASGCAAVPATLDAYIASPSPSGTPTLSPSPSGTPTPTPSPSGTPTLSPSPSGTPTPTPSPSGTPTPSPSPSPGPKTPHLCILMQPSSGARVQPGHTATYSITVWATRAPGKGTAVTIKAQSAAHISSPKFTACPSAGGATCTLGNLPLHQARNLQASITVGDRAARGEHVELTGDASATGAAPVSASATVLVAGRAAPSRRSSTRGIGGATNPATTLLPPLPPTTILPWLTLPVMPGDGFKLTAPTLKNPGLLFPTVSPSPIPSARPRPIEIHLTRDTTAAALPSYPPLSGAQWVGLGLLAAAAIAVTTAWLQRSTQRPGDGGKKAR